MELKRKAYAKMVEWKNTPSNRALLVTGARQVGKTFLIREFGRAEYRSFVEINLLENQEAREALAAAGNADDLFLRLSVFANGELIPGETLIFLDEVQECKEIVTAVKFLVERGGFDYVLSGSLLGVELNDIRSWPVGYLATITMYPLDFEEFCWANGIGAAIIKDSVSVPFIERRPIDDFLHNRLTELLHQYLICGGMPDAVRIFIETKNVQQLRSIQQDIIDLYRKDISQYAKDRSRIVKQIFDLIPSELNKQNKRFVVKEIDGNSRVARYENDFLWIADAGVALPVFSVTEPRYPLKLNIESRKFKLFLNDVGLLTCMCGMNVTKELIGGRRDVNFGSIYENAIAQELCAHGFDLFYFTNRGIGELDFVIQTLQGPAIPIEVKSGKDYRRHSALSKALATENYAIEDAIVFHDGNIEQEDRITYAPAYTVLCLDSPDMAWPKR